MLFEIERNAADLDAHIGEMMFAASSYFSDALQQRLRRDAADIQARAAERLTLFSHGHLHPQLGAADGAHITAGTGPDDDDIEFF
jgi:hypothetical protein